MTKRRHRGGATGERELALLRWVAEHGPVTVGEASAEYGASHGIARTTVQTMLERLHEKGRLLRARDGGVFRYRSALATGELLSGLVRSFVEGPLGGNLSPFVAYLAEREELTAAEVQELEQLVERIGQRVDRGSEEDPV